MQVFGRACAVLCDRVWWFSPEFADRMSQTEPFSEQDNFTACKPPPNL